MKIIARVCIVIAVCYLLICGAVYFFQEKLIFPGTKLPADFKYVFAEPFKEVNIPVQDAQLNALIFEPKGESKGVVIYFHGNGGALDRWGSIANDFTSRGYTLLIVDYRGYGKSTGSITNQQQLFDDAKKVYDYAATQFPNSVKIIWGRSIGTGIAAELASHNKVHVLVLETPYYSLQEVATSQKPYLPVKVLMKYPIPTHEYVSKVDAPIFIIHGTADRIIPYASAKKLASSMKSTFVTVPNGGHELDGTPEFKQFLDEVLR